MTPIFGYSPSPQDNCHRSVAGWDIPSPQNDLDGQHISRDQWVGGCLPSEYNPATCFLSDLERSRRRPRETSIWCWRAWCAGVSFPSLATWPNRLLRILIIDPWVAVIACYTPVLSSYLGVIDTVIPSDPENMPLTYHLKGLQALGVGGK